MTARASYEVGANMPPCKLKCVAKKKSVAFFVLFNGNIIANL